MKKTLRIFSFHIIILLLVLVILEVHSSNFRIEIGKAEASSLNGWLGNWQFRKSHIINPVLGAGTNYQVQIKVHYGSGIDGGEDVYLNGKCRSDFGDIRFASSVPFIEFYRITIPSEAHDAYGLGYPVTYIFTIPSASSNLKAYKNTGTVWQQLPEKTSNDLFNGIECVRFDYSNNKAYVSVAFAENSDYIDVKITNQDGNVVNVEYKEMAQYYDNRIAAVVAAADDWTGGSRHQNFMRSCDVFQSKQVWLTVGVITQSYQGDGAPDWHDIQQQINEGYIEVASHSRTHSSIPYDNYDSEIGGSKDDLLGNLSLPSPYKKGENEYVWCWIEPYGASDSNVRQKLGQYKYLIARSTDRLVTSFATWDSIGNLYERVGVTVDTFGNSLDDLNSLFDNAYANGGIYHFYFHPNEYDWTSENVISRHLDHIKGKKDVWYVGFGAYTPITM